MSRDPKRGKEKQPDHDSASCVADAVDLTTRIRMTNHVNQTDSVFIEEFIAA